MGQSYKVLQVSVNVFRVLAWVALAAQVVTGMILIIGGGEDLLIGGTPLSARLVGVLNLAAGPVYFYALWLISSLIRIMLDIRQHLPGGT